MDKFKLELGIEDEPEKLPSGALTLGDFEDFIYSKSPKISFTNRVHVKDEVGSIVAHIRYSKTKLLLKCVSPYEDPNRGTHWLSELVKVSLMSRHEFPNWRSIPIFVQHNADKDDDSKKMIPVIGFEIELRSPDAQAGRFYLVLDESV